MALSTVSLPVPSTSMEAVAATAEGGALTGAGTNTVAAAVAAAAAAKAVGGSTAKLSGASDAPKDWVASSAWSMLKKGQFPQGWDALKKYAHFVLLSWATYCKRVAGPTRKAGRRANHDNAQLSWRGRNRSTSSGG
ncbi:hypothetical protein DFJ73DRAFT_956992 [Zopfochytrium polystomum]|nr:hypothetical protein DFJ73DRAFT_956992 [Zopfochytrium polystomum]